MSPTNKNYPSLCLPGCLLAICVIIAGCGASTEPFLPEFPVIDLVIEDGLVVDGLGGDAYEADVVVVAGQIVFVGDSHFSDADNDTRIARRIDADGRVVSPGFIDLHSHGDPLKTPAMENFLAMGVTTITLGQDGSSPGVEDLRLWLDEVRSNGLATNLAMFVGHGTLRTLSGIGRKVVPSEAELDDLVWRLEQSLEVAFGMSTGLEYNPGLNAEAHELRELAKVVGRNDRMIMSHMRNEDDDALEQSIDELLALGHFARVHISHLKSVYGKGGARADALLAILNNARGKGVRVTADVYPYNASYTGIALLFPTWAKTLDQFAIAQVERRDELADYLRNRVMRRNGPQATLLGTPPFTGKTLEQLARELEKPFEEVLIDDIGPDGASGAYFIMDDELQTRLIIDDQVGICSDGSPTGFHPRGHGTFAKVIERYVVAEKLLSLEEAVRKMTSHSAQILGLKDRGVVKVGKKADLLIFDPAHVIAKATYSQPLQLAEGFDVVVVNGKVAREAAQVSKDFSGVVLSP